MPQFLKWLIFIALLAGYIWAVFFWERGNLITEPDLPDHSDSTTMNIETVNDEPEYTDYTESYEDQTDSTIYESSYTEETESNTEDAAETIVDEVSAETVTPNSSDKYAIISGSYTNRAQADKALGQYLSKYGLNGEVVFYDPYYKVVLATAGSMADAKSELNKITELGVSAFIQKNP